MGFLVRENLSCVADIKNPSTLVVGVCQMLSMDVRRDRALRIRQAAEREIENGSGYFCHFKKDLMGLCAICSSALAKDLKKAGDDVKICKGWFRGRHGHCWVESRTDALDITATQFWGVHKPIMIINKSKRLYRDLFQFGFEAKSLDAFGEWPEEQRPTEERIERLLQLSGLI